MSNAGDSISQAYAANGVLGDHPELSWVQGTEPSVQSIFLRYRDLNPEVTQEPVSVSGSEMTAGEDNFAAQALRICAQEVLPTVVSVLFGGNDVCHRERSSGPDAAALLYPVESFIEGAKAGLDVLAGCLPVGAHVHVLSVPRVDLLYEAGHDKGFHCGSIVWPAADICRVVTDEEDPARRAQIGARIDEYNVALASEVETYARRTGGRNPRGVGFSSDWRGSIADGARNTSLGTVVLTAADINGTDCFHPNEDAQRRLACTAWASGPHGPGSLGDCWAP